MAYLTTSINTFSFNPLSDFSKRGNLLPLDCRSKRSSSRVEIISTRILASRKDHHQANHDHHHHNYMSSGRLVDENMIVLRKRIHEMKMFERNYEPPPSDWMDWEKKYYTSYDSLICQMVGLLQSQMMNTRPSLALGMVLLVIFSVPVSSAMILAHLMDLAKGLFINN